MSKINVLDQNTINQIAAGEVIERPSSVVKELVENAMDAGATAVTVEIKDGGLSLIRVTDNGEGIPAEEIPLAFLRHSTSKIRNVEDLLTISSLGFRGEALSSIASVAQVELITKTNGTLTGSRYRIEGGEEKDLQEIGAPSGTTFLVRNLFYNTPARRKFLKSAATEGSYISSLLEHLALSHPEVSFRLLINNQNKLHTSGNNNLKDIIYTIYGRDITQAVIPIKHETENVKLTGFIGKPEINRGNRTFETYFINGRYVKSVIITKALENAYRGFVMQHKYPFAVFHMTIDSSFLDVNVHPTKMELRFRNEEEVYNAVYNAVRDALTGRELIPTGTFREEDKKPQPVRTPVHGPEPFEAKRRDLFPETGKQYSGVREKISYEPSTIEKIQRNVNNSILGNQMVNSRREVMDPLPAKVSEKREDIAESGRKGLENAAIVDEILAYGSHKHSEYSESADSEQYRSEHSESKMPQNECSERDRTGTISTEGATYNKDFQEGKSPAKVSVTEVPMAEDARQLNLFEERLLVASARQEYRLIGQLFDTYWLIQYKDNFFIMDQHAAHEKVLYERTMKRIQNQEYLSQQVQPPIILTLNARQRQVITDYAENFEHFGFRIEPFGGKEYAVYSVPANMFGIARQEILTELIDTLADDSGHSQMTLIEEKIALMSCKAAVKGNNSLSFKEAEALLDEIMTLDNPYMCPHGRPTIITMTRYELEKKFKRIIN